MNGLDRESSSRTIIGRQGDLFVDALIYIHSRGDFVTSYWLTKHRQVKSMVLVHL